MDTEFDQFAESSHLVDDDGFALCPIERPRAPQEFPPTPQRPKFEPILYPELEFPRCSFLEMKLWFSLVTLAMAGMPWIQPKLFAGICGLAALIWLAIITMLQFDGRTMFIVWWAILAAYAIGCAVAMTYG